MKKLIGLVCVSFVYINALAQTDVEMSNPQVKKENEEKAKAAKAETQKKLLETYAEVKSLNSTNVKNQGMTGTCWCFSTTSLVESQCLKNNLGDFDLSEMFSVRNTYIEKAKNYILRQGNARFDEGGLGHDLINAIAKYGAMPEIVYNGFKPTEKINTDSKLRTARLQDSVQKQITTVQQHNHVKLIASLKKYVDSIIKLKPVPLTWQRGFEEILNEELGTPPSTFMYNGKEYTPKTFADNILKFNADDYVYITSFTHHPYYSSFVVEVPDNFSNGAYYNLPLNEMIQVTKDVIGKGYTALWDADVSNDGFNQRVGMAVDLSNTKEPIKSKSALINGTINEGKYDAERRQKLFEELTTQDDHLMHITGLYKGKDGKSFFEVKNSWGDVGPRNGFITVSENYFAINTITVIVPKAGLKKELLEKLKIK